MIDLHACRREPCLEQRQTCKPALHSSWQGSTCKPRRAIRAKVSIALYIHPGNHPPSCVVEPQ